MREAGLVALAMQQHGLVTRAQAVAGGLTEKAIEVRLGSGLWTAVQQSVYRVGGAPATFEQQMLAAVLACDRAALGSHRGALRLWDIGGRDAQAEVTTDRRHGYAPADVTVHRIADISLAQPSSRRGVPVTSPLRTLVDAGAVVPPYEVDRAIDAAIAVKLVTVAGLAAEVARLSKRGRAGVGVMRRALDRRGVTPARPPSALESPAYRIFVRYGLPLPSVEYPVADGRYRVDFAYPERAVAIEVDGYADHSGVDSFQHDRERQNWLVTHGWRVLRFTDADVRFRGGRVATAVRSVLGGNGPL